MRPTLRRPFADRLRDRAWSFLCDRFDDTTPPPVDAAKAAQSISGTLDWPNAGAALANGSWSSRNFRRRRAVRQVVETLGLCDGRHFARSIAGEGPQWLAEARFERLNDWGNPLQAPGWSLGLPRSFSPTSLRYLAHALWLRHEGLVKPGGLIVEIGVGFGGLAAMNALVSNARTVCIDLPEVEQAAAVMMLENGMESFLAVRNEIEPGYCFISNYAFTELSIELQDRYFDEFIRHAACGAIVSNAAIFARHIGGRDHDALVTWFRDAGLNVQSVAQHPILGPSDLMCDNRLIYWTTS